MARYQHFMTERSYRAYVTDGIKLLLENTAVSAAYCSDGEEGKGIALRWIDAIDSRPKEQKSGGEIVQDVIQKGGLVPKIKKMQGGNCL